MSETSKLLLIREQYVSFSKPLALMLNPTKAMLLEHLHFWVQVVKEKAHKKNRFEGKYWWYHSIKQWRDDFPFLSDSTLDRSLKGLRDAGLISISKNPNPGITWSDQTNWYTVNGTDIDALIKEGTKRINGKKAISSKCRTDNSSKCRTDNSSKCRTKEHTKNRDKEAILTAGPKTGPAGVQKQIRQKHRETFLKRFHEAATIPSLAKLWEMSVTEFHGRKRYLPLASSAKDRKCARTFIKYCKEADIDVPDLLEWIIQNWNALRERKSLKWANFGTSPSFTTVYALKDKFIDAYRSRDEETAEGGSTAKIKKRKYTDASQVPKNHPHYKSIMFKLKKHGVVEI